jgi:hypothetical protein
VFERFGAAAAEFSGLYWSHFQSALDWDDAEMWLEGAVQSRWSVAEMRRQRWETRGIVENRTAGEPDLASELPEDDFAPSPFDAIEASSRGSRAASEDSAHDTDDDASARRTEASDRSIDDDAADDKELSPEEDRPAPRPAPFAHLAELPDDLAEAFEAFKLAIVRHRLAGWQEAARDDVLAALDALRELALSPVD